MLQYMDEQKDAVLFHLLLNKVAQIILDFVHEQNTCFDFSSTITCRTFSTVTMFVSGLTRWRVIWINPEFTWRKNRMFNGHASSQLRSFSNSAFRFRVVHVDEIDDNYSSYRACEEVLQLLQPRPCLLAQRIIFPDWNLRLILLFLRYWHQPGRALLLYVRQSNAEPFCHGHCFPEAGFNLFVDPEMFEDRQFALYNNDIRLFRRDTADIRFNLLRQCGIIYMNVCKIWI